VKRDWKKDRANAAKHARLIRRKPELREALYGPPTQDERRLARDLIDAASRETAQRKE
jgi:hypothetical protein